MSPLYKRRGNAVPQTMTSVMVRTLLATLVLGGTNHYDDHMIHSLAPHLRRRNLPWRPHLSTTDHRLVDQAPTCSDGSTEKQRTLAPGQALDALLRPRSIAVIGASRSAGSIGHQIVANLVSHGFTGAVYPINPNASAICSIPAYPSIESLPHTVDMAVVAVPKDTVPGVVEACGRAGIHGVVVISAGFREVGGEGIERERALMEIVKRYDMRMVGPNCMGVLNSHPAVSMNATFAPVMPPCGGAAFVSQSGAVGINVLDYARELGIGIAQFVSVGNKPDVSGNDLLEQWENDPTVEQILMYVENFGNPRNFLSIARRVARHKPIIVVKAGRSQAGARAASSHTGALAASNDIVDAMLEQAGVLRADSIEEMFDMVMAFTGERRPGSRRTAVITNAGGPGILAADALEARGLEVVALADSTLEKLKPLFPPEASVRNPLDMIASAHPESYRAALNTILDDPNVDSALAIFVPPLGVNQQDVARAIGGAAELHPDKPVLAVLMGVEGLPQGRAELHRAGVPAYTFPESAARALAALCRHNEWSSRPEPSSTPITVDSTAAQLVLNRTAGVERKLPEVEALELLKSYGIATAPLYLAHTAEEAIAIAERIGMPVAMKASSPRLLHKSDAGGVQLNVATADEVRMAFHKIAENVRHTLPDAQLSGIVVQKMVKSDVELIVGMTRDSSFGPVVLFGLGGLFAEVLHDVTMRIAPVSHNDALEMIDGIRGKRLLDGYRGLPPVDRELLADLLVRVSQLALDHPGITELDINPLVATPQGLLAVDARVLLSQK